MKLLLADDHALFRDGIRALLTSAWPEISLIETATFRQTVDAALAHDDLDLILLDLRMPGGNHSAAIRSLIASAPNTPVIAISAYQSADLIQSVLKLGVRGFLPKSSDSGLMQRAIKQVLHGDIYVPPEALAEQQPRPDGIALTRRQKQVLTLLGEGLSNKEICRHLGISERTVKMHITALMEKFNACNRTQVAIMAVAEQP